MKLPLRSSLSKMILSSTLLYTAIAQSFISAQSGNPISDPIPGDVPFGTLTFKIEDFVRIPQSSGGGQGHARINHLKPDGMGRLFVNDLRGRMFLVSEGQANVYLDLASEIGGDFNDSPGLGAGFSSFAFHPEFSSNGKFYTDHTEDPGSAPADFTTIAGQVAAQGVVTEWTATDPTAATFVGTRREILRADMTHTIHGMQEISFNTAAASSSSDYGNLYICIGDSGSTIQGFPQNTARLDSVLGTILRINPLGTDSANGQYGIPADNPWVADGEPNTFGEIFALGFRNPHRISWDANDETKMFSGEIGERWIEEINLIEPGRFYGWNIREGTWVINEDWVNNPDAGENDEIFALPANDADLGYTYPVAMYDHNEGPAVVGGYVYRGPSNEAAQGQYIFGEIRHGNLYYFDADSVVQNQTSTIQRAILEYDGTNYGTLQDITGSGSGNRDPDLRLGYDGDNELYLLSKHTGWIYKVASSIVEPVEPEFINISTRGKVADGNRALIGGFVITGTEDLTVLIQGVGDELVSANSTLSGLTLNDVQIYLYDGSNNEIAMNDDWDSENAAFKKAAMVAAGSFDLGSGSLSSALLETLSPGGYTVILSGVGGAEGLALVEAYSVPSDALDNVNFALNRPATATSTYDAPYLPGSALDGNDETRWASQDETEPVLEIDLGGDIAFNEVRINERNPQVTSYNIEYFDGTDWKIAHTGAGIASPEVIAFDTVIGSKIRFNVTSSTREPSIWEFQVFNR